MREKWVWIALLIAVPLILLQLVFGVRVTADQQGIPLLTVLLMNEFGFFLSVFGVGVAIKTIRDQAMQYKLLLGAVAASLCAVGFLLRVLQLFPQVS